MGVATRTLVTNIVGSTTNTYYLPVLEQSTHGAYAGIGKLYTVADTIDMILNNAADQLKITVRALCIPVAGP
jgi:hypothetical protein